MTASTDKTDKTDKKADVIETKVADAISAVESKIVPTPLKKVTLLKPHSHNDNDYVAGDVIEVSHPDYEFLVKHGVVK